MFGERIYAGTGFSQVARVARVEDAAVGSENYVSRAVAALPELAAISNKNSTVQPQRGSMTRSVMIAPTVRDAKTLLKFAFSRGLLIGRDPIAIVAAVVIVVARLHGVKVSVDRAAQASRVQSVSVRKRLKELLGEIIAFAKKFPWGEDMSMKRPRRLLGHRLQIHCHRGIEQRIFRLRRHSAGERLGWVTARVPNGRRRTFESLR